MSNREQPNESGNATKGNREGEPSAIIPPPSSPSNGTAESKKGFCEKYKHEMELLGLLGLIFYCFINWREWKTFESERQTMEAEFQASETSSAAQLKALQGQMEEMRVSREDDERAWVYAEIEDNSLVRDGTNLVFYISVKNSGKTAALCTGNVLRAALDVSQINRYDPEVTGGEAVLAPNNTIRIPQNVPPLLITYTGSNPIYLYGTIFYKDFTGKKHWTQFCYSITHSGEATGLIYGHGLTDDMDKMEKENSN
jgi:hypothetical protein